MTLLDLIRLHKRRTFLGQTAHGVGRRQLQRGGMLANVKMALR